MANPLRWPEAVVAGIGVTGVVILCSIAMALGHNGFVLATGLAIIGTAVGGAIGHQVGRRRGSRADSTTESEQPVDITPPTG